MTPPRPQRKSGRPPGADPAARRAEILDAAEKLFSTEGYRGVSMSLVARESGMSQTGLVHHFPTKDDLLSAVLDRRDEHDMAQFDLGRSLRGWEVIRSLIALVRHNESQETMVRLYTSVAGEAVTAGHPANEWLQKHHGASRSMMERSVAEAVELGQLRPDAPAETISRLLIAAMDGLQLQWLTDADYPTMVDDFEALVDTLYARWKA
ncbi:TetR/AcrR family transcriptional regulator [Zhihengliuella halotolerans]|uniref:TetR family transcriptional regulator n=1 Tax=Zhihengliuella halotolerans TaxID=370736 RepID=A0A4Q8AH39_9MICC|nr:TetR/AcrR family transcriptional regulator [Zhihengliuella halotolerans]RZU63710.1 TetR family transcriptional regulator [Zhihengliuella halotolerans]